MPSLTDSYIENRDLVQPNHGNTYGTAHGGHVVRWMDEVGAMAAMRHAGETCVTARIGGVDFEHALPVGDVALLEAYVYAVGETSLRVHVRAAREDPLTAETEAISRSRFVYVALDDEREPTPVPALTVESERGERLRERALAAERAEE